MVVSYRSFPIARLKGLTELQYWGVGVYTRKQKENFLSIFKQTYHEIMPNQRQRTYSAVVKFWLDFRKIS